MRSIAYQEELRPGLPTVIGNVDDQEFRATLLRIDEILEQGGLERQFVEERVRVYRTEAQGRPGETNRVGERDLARVARHASQALRCNVARMLLGETSRAFSARLADSPLLQEFCRVSKLDVIRVPSKSTVDRYGKMVDAETIRKVVGAATRAAAAPVRQGGQALGLTSPVDLDAYFLDTTCVPANIHFPVDWVLLRDAVRTLIKAIGLIRKHGLKHRMGKPEQFVRKINCLCMEMTQAARKKKDSNKERKRVLRRIKALVQVVRGHATRYRKLLADRWEETDLAQGNVRQILGRIDDVLGKLPAAMKQAHERIIGGRKVPDAEKILSLYEPDVHVIVRGKAGMKVEFGNTLLLGELASGLIVDWKLFEDRAPVDAHLVPESLERFEQVLGRAPRAVSADRGFDAAGNTELLRSRKIYNAICPKNPHETKARMGQQRFVKLQRRRAQTEGRVGIFKNSFLGRPMRSKGFGNRQRDVAWAVLAHNLWVIARLPTAAQQERECKRAA